MIARFRVEASDSCPGYVRQRAREFFTVWGVVDVDDVLLVLTELVTNAVKTSPPGAPVGEVKLVVGEGAVLVVVTDACRSVPSVQSPDADDESGRGMCIVDALSSDWGHYVYDGCKTVWATVPINTDRPTLVNRRNLPGKLGEILYHMLRLSNSHA